MPKHQRDTSTKKASIQSKRIVCCQFENGWLIWRLQAVHPDRIEVCHQHIQWTNSNLLKLPEKGSVASSLGVEGDETVFLFGA